MKYAWIVGGFVIVALFFFNPIIGALGIAAAVFLAWCAMKFNQGQVQAGLSRELDRREGGTGRSNDM